MKSLSIQKLVLIIFILSSRILFAQDIALEGFVLDKDSIPLIGSNIQIPQTSFGTTTDSNGYFELQVPIQDSYQLKISYIGYQEQIIAIEKLAIDQKITIFLVVDSLQTIVVTEEKFQPKISTFHIDPKSVDLLPSPFGDFNKILSTLAGVSSNNELSSTYSVRGGSIAENLVYVNNIEVYRPFLIRAGRQEGLSFINPDLVETIEFSAGGWEAQYGDKLSSMLAIQYKKPEKWEANGNIGLLGGRAYIGGVAFQEKLSFVLGIRHKNSRYLLSTLPTQGEYFPRFTDVQSFVTYQFSERDKLELLTAYAQNRYEVEPTTRETDFGTLNQTFRLTVAFDGREKLEYELYQSALKYTHEWDAQSSSSLIVSAMNTREREFLTLESGYRLAEVINQSLNLNDLLNSQDLGTEYENARNRLNASIFHIENRNTFQLTADHQIDLGIRLSQEEIFDNLIEFSFIDSVGYVINPIGVNTRLSLISQRLQGYLQHTFSINNQHFFNYGIRLNYWTINEELLFSPRFQYAFRPNWLRDYTFKFAVGVYQQPPFYRELRNQQGILNLDLMAQKSWHFILGTESYFLIADRQFKWTTEAYYKQLQDVIPYDIDNVRLRYFAENNATAYAYGLDFRISGEFVKDAVSWFSLSFLRTEENIENDNLGFVRRPTDQRITAAIYFEDYLPSNPTWRVNLRLLYGTGLPFSPPDNPEFRAALSAPSYRRVDIGFSKLIVGNKGFDSIWIGLDILNLLGTQNTISYNWIRDVNNQQFAIPNTLSTRFANFRVNVKF